MSATPHDSLTLQGRIAHTVARARLFGAVEQLWPRLVVVASIAGLFLILSWLGVWPLLNDYLRLAIVTLFGLALLAAGIWALQVPRPSRDEAVKRVEASSGLTGRPLAALEDTPFDTRTPQGAALWQVHQARMARTVETLAAGAPAPRTQILDKWALRAPVLLLVVVAFFVAGPQRVERIEQAFAPPSTAPTIPVRVDVWATPPAYTGLPPRTLISAATLDETLQQPTGAQVPTGSRLTVLISDPTAVTVSLNPLEGPSPQAITPSQDDAGTLEAVLEAAATLVLETRGASIDLPILVTPDSPPTIAFTQRPEASTLGALELSYLAEDDYAVQSARAEVHPAEERYSDATPLVPAPTIDLVLPQDRRGGSVETTRDLSSHPWAGLSIDMTLSARDGADQEGTSQTLTLDLPVRPFREDLARALVEQRRLLAIDPRLQPRVVTALEGLAIAPDQFMEGDYTTFLALTVTTQRLRLADSDAQKLEVIDLLWQLALQVEDGDLSLAAERLREAEENLSNALENGASPEELADLMDELRQAFEEYMQALAERMQNGDVAQLPQDMPLQNIDPSAMQDLMDQIEDLAELGAADAARQLLDQLREQLDQLRGAQAMQQREMSPQEQQLRESIQSLQDITREQQRLLDETFPFSNDAQRQESNPPSPFAPQGPENEQTQRPPNNRPSDNLDAQPQEGSPLDDLAQQQRDLQQQLNDLMNELAELGLDPSDFGEAGDAMEGAANMLDRQSANNAMTEQGRALEALRQGAQSMMEQLAEGQGQQGQGEGQAQGPGQSPGPGQGLPRMMFGQENGGARGTDPLGRPQRDSGQTEGGSVRIPEESDIQRARDILNEIQRRLGDQLRPQTERDYLDRLIERF